MKTAWAFFARTHPLKLKVSFCGLVLFVSASTLASVKSRDSISYIESGATAVNATAKTEREKADFQLRWHRVFSLADHPTEQNKQSLISALKSADWYMRDAALRALPKFSEAEARNWARKLIDDPSLVVRTTAVQILAVVQTDADRSLFWKKLIAKENFHGGQSLWIRRHLVKALAMRPAPAEKMRFEALLSDPDSRLYPAAHQALDRISISGLCASKSGPSGAPGGCDKE